MYTPKSMEGVKSRIQELEAELATDARWRELRILRNTEEQLAALVNGSKTVRIGVSTVEDRHVRPHRKGKQPKGKVAQHVAARLAVEAAGYPLKTSELVRELPKFGAAVSSENAERNLTSILSKRGELFSTRWRGEYAWWLQGEGPPPE